MVFALAGARTEESMSNGESSRERGQHNPALASKTVFDERRVTAWIGTALIVQGKVISAQDLTIDGRVEGTIELGDHGLTIGQGAEIKADLVAKTISISGSVTGNVTATDRVDLRATGSVDGNIVAPRFAMAEGAVIKGKVDANRKSTTKGNSDKTAADSEKG
jgi:cytoskeletal protein CcmA (bactofilin family)